MKTGKTSTFTIHHDTCNPEAWTPNDVLKFAKFIKSGGDMRYAAALARIGVQLILSDHHTAKGGSIQEIGFAKGGEVSDGISEDLNDFNDGDEVLEVSRVYVGPREYVVIFAVGDPETGDIDGHETEIFATEAEAVAFIESMHEKASSHV